MWPGLSDIDLVRTCNNGTLSGSGSYSKASCPAAASCACNLPWGGTIASGNSTTAYQTSSVACGSSCTSQTRTCTNGSLSGSYTNASCSVAACSSCTLDGATTASGSSRTYYLTSRSCGATCASISQSRTCTNGTLGGSASYSKASCPAESCSSCTLDGATTAHNGTRTYYLTSRSCGQACTAIDLVRTCTNGTLSGSSSYSKASCPAAAACSSCTLPWGGSIAHGANTTAYSTASVSCGSSCTSETRSCNNGSLSGSYTNGSCTVGSCNCLVGGSTINNGSCATRWNRTTGWSSGSCGPTCASTSVCCTNGTASPSGYTRTNCTIEPCCGGVPC